MRTSLVETQALAQLAEILYSFLPGSGAVYTWRELAADNDVEAFWPGGSKLPAITTLLEQTFLHRRDKFCDVILTAVSQGMKYRIKKGNPATREEIEKMNAVLRQLQFKIPELHEPHFLQSLRTGSAGAPTRPQVSPQSAPSGASAMAGDIAQLHQQFLSMFRQADHVKRGFEFEQFLNELFFVHGLAPRGSFRVKGEQIDGSFEWHGQVFLVEARWRQQPAAASDLYGLRCKAEKSEWTRGLFISIFDFSDLAADTFSTGRRVNLITMSGHDLILILEGIWTLPEAIRAKLRSTGESSNVHVPLVSLSQR